MIAVEVAVSPLLVECMDFPYRKAGRRPPDRAPKLIAAVVEAAEAFITSLAVKPDWLLLGGLWSRTNFFKHDRRDLRLARRWFSCVL